MKIKYKLEKITDNICLCFIKDSYDLAMTFCRIQEFYESPFKEIRGKKFNLLRFIELYSKDREGNFTYPTDWIGFNIPSTTIQKMFDLGIDDFNHYDQIIKKIHKSYKTKYYLIAAANKDNETINHELCHAFYFLYKDYKYKANKLVKKLSPSVYKEIKDSLLELGYCKAVIDDEIQAYLSTDGCNEIDDINFNKKDTKNFNIIKKELQTNFIEFKLKNNIKY